MNSMLAQPKHRIWPSMEAYDPGFFERAMGHAQVNDAYLVALARHEKGRLATFDRRLVAHDPTGQVVKVISTAIEDGGTGSPGSG